MCRNTDRPLNWETVGITLLGCGLLLAWQMGLCVQVCLWCRIMKPVNQEIREMVDGMSAKLGIPVCRVFEMELGMWNALDCCMA